MVMPVKDLTGLKFGYLTVLERDGSSKNKNATWLCQCVCGVKVVRIGSNLHNRPLRPGKASCGCAVGEAMLEGRERLGMAHHGMSDTRPYRIWCGMRSRCSNTRDKDFANYGGRGITVTDTWENSFESFWDDMSNGYQKHLTLDRADNMKGYSKQNCHWATASEQSNNTRVNQWINTPEGLMTVAQAARFYKIKTVTLYARIFRYKWEESRWFEDAKDTFRNKLICTPNGEMTLLEASKYYKINIKTLHSRIFRSKLAPEDWFKQPIKKKEKSTIL
jgi:hypothetical protein